MPSIVRFMFVQIRFLYILCSFLVYCPGCSISASFVSFLPSVLSFTGYIFLYNPIP